MRHEDPSGARVPARSSRRSARLVAAALAVGLVGAPSLLPGPAAADPAVGGGEKARPASDFLNSLGVNIHMSYGRTRYADPNATVAALRELGFTHVRENFRPDNKAEHQRLRVLRDAGIRFTFIIPRPDEPDGQDPARSVDVIAREFADATHAIEGPNEYNNTKQANWPSRLRDSQRVLRRSAAQNPATADLPIYGPSLIGFKMRKDAPKVGNLASELDFGNVHSYPGGETPENEVDKQLSTYGQYISDGKPGVATETGYHNATSNTHRSGHPSTTERTAGVYYPRLYFEYFRRGVGQTFGYELFDEGTTADQEDHFGLFRVDGSPKPAATALGNLTAILADPGGAPRQDQLAFDLADSDGDEEDVRHVLLQKSDGTFYLALWRSDSIAEPGRQSAAPQDKPVTSSPLTVQLDEPASAARAFRPTSSRDASGSWADTREITTPVGPDVTLIELSPDGTPAPSTPPGTTPPEDGSDGNGGSPAPGDGQGDNSGGNDSGGNDSGGNDGTPAPGDEQGNGGEDDGGDTAPPSTPGQPDADGILKVLPLPELGTTDWTPKRLTGTYRIQPPTSRKPLAKVRYQVDGVPLPGDVLDAGKLPVGRHVVQLAGQSAAGDPVLSAQVVDVARDRPEAKTVLALLGAGLLAAQVGGIISFQRRRRLRAGG